MTKSPEAERPATYPDVPPEAPRDTRRAWDKMDKATEAGEFTKEVRTALGKPQAIPSRLRAITDYLFQACDMLDRLEKEARTTLGTNTRLKAEYNKLEAENKCLEAEIKMLGRTNTTFFEERERLKAQVKQVVDEQKEDKYYLPKQCPNGGEHRWKAICSKCGMKIWHNSKEQE